MRWLRSKQSLIAGFKAYAMNEVDAGRSREEPCQFLEMIPCSCVHRPLVSVFNACHEAL